MTLPVLTMVKSPPTPVRFGRAAAYSWHESMRTYYYDLSLTSNTSVNAVAICIRRIHSEYDHIDYFYLLLDPGDTPPTFVHLTSFFFYV